MNNQHSTIRVLHVLTAMNRAGAETMLMNLYRSIDREKVQFDFAVSTTEKCDYDEEIELLGGRLIRYPRYKGNNHFSYVRWWNEFFQTNHEYAIVHGHIGSTAAIYLKIAKKYGCFTIAHSHSASQLKSFHDYMYKLYSYRTRYIADFFIGCSEKALVSRYGKRVARNKQKCTILENSIDIKQYAYSSEVCQQVKEELNIKDYGFIVGTVGRFTEAKNPFFIVDIIYELKKTCADFKFLWAGTGELKEKVVRYIHEKKLQDDILLLGVRNDIPRILQAMNVFILPSQFEGLPVVGIEVQAAGIPMLCSDRVTPEIGITDCVKFLHINSTDPWVEALQKEKTFRRCLGAPEELASAGYDVVAESKKLVAFYHSIMNDHTGDGIE